MVDPILFRKKVLLAKIESAYGTDPTLSGSANAILATDVSIRPMEGQDVSRNLIQDYLGGSATIPAGLHVVIEFSTELAGSGTAGTAPAWGPLIRACGCAETIVADTSVAYTPVSDAMESLYIKFWLGSTLHALKGARGDATVGLNAEGIPTIRWTLTGLYVDPATVSSPSADVDGFEDPLIASSANTPTFTVNDVSLVLRSWSFKLGNQVVGRFLIGRDEIMITDRTEALDLTVEATPLATFNPYALAKATTPVPVALVHGTTAGNIVRLDLPTCQVKRPTGYQENQGIAEWPLALMPLPDAGDDQFTITLT